MAPNQYTRVVLAERPTAEITPTTFKIEHLPFNLKPGNGQVLVQVLYLSLDPAMRVWLKDIRSYTPPVQIGELMKGSGIGIVTEVGTGSQFAKGDIVKGSFGWTDHKVVDDKDVTKHYLPKNADIIDLLGPLGGTGLTAYFGLLEIGQIKAGETLVVSGAAGATGSVVCQIGKLKGAKVVAIAGSAEKVEWLEKELGVDKAINYKSPTFHQEFDEAVGLFDVFFDNVGGEILDYALTRMNKNARIAFCGSISQYNAETPRGLVNYLNIILQRATLRGFITSDYASRFPEALADISTWIENGSLKRRYHVIQGIENAPISLNLLYTGGNNGKLVVKVSNPPAS